MSEWKSINQPPENDDLVVVAWGGGDDQKVDFDFYNEECWQVYKARCEHNSIAGIDCFISVATDKEDPPYEFWMPIPPLPKDKDHE